MSVIIIGGGAAGLAAASRLSERGVKNFTLLESRDRLGGRIFTTNIEGDRIEAGACWIHGEDGNVVYDLAKELDVVETDPLVDDLGYPDVGFVSADGSELPEDLLHEMRFVLAKLGEDENDDMKKFNGSIEEFFKLRLNDYIKNHPTHENLKRSMLDWHLKITCSYNGSDTMSNISTKTYDSFKECPGRETLYWKGGYYQLVKFLQDKIPTKNIRLNTEVTRITWSNDVAVECTTGETFTAKHVIVTLPLGVLKDNYVVFNPPLPQYKLNVIQNIAMGTINKIYLKFATRWWPDGGGFSLIWPQDKSTWNDDLKTLKDSWAGDVFGFYSVFNNPTVLCGWVYGEAARKMEETSEEEVESVCMRLLKGFLSTRFNVPKPTSIYRSSWFSDKYSRGSYTHRTFSTDKADAWPNQLAQPLCDGNGSEVLLFGGEATHDDYFSTVHGAVETGWREAERVIKLINE